MYITLGVTSSLLVSCCNVCNEEERVRTAVFTGVHLYRVAPSLYNPILGLVWWFFPSTILQPTRLHPVDRGAELLSLSVSEFSSLLQTGGSQLLISSRAYNNPKPLHPSPCSYTCLSYSLQNQTCKHLYAHLHALLALSSYSQTVWVKLVTVFVIAAYAKSAPGSWQACSFDNTYLIIYFSKVAF